MNRFFALIFLFVVAASNGEQHYCNRECNRANTKPMLCKYKWNIEEYSILSKACLNCPLNKTHCYNVDCISGNGVSRSIITVNKMMPGPQVRVCKGDTISVRVHNMLHNAQSTSIHWHGILQKGTPYMDGVSSKILSLFIYFDYSSSAYII